MSGWSASSTVLVVAHRRDSRERYRRLLDDYGVRTAEGAAALDAAEDADAVVLDCASSGDADELLSDLRSASADCRVAVVTDGDPDEDLVARGYDAVLTAPVVAAELTDVVDRLLRMAAYVEAVEEYHAACERRATEGGDARDGPVVDDELRSLRERVDELAAGFDAADYRVVFRDLDDPP